MAGARMLLRAGERRPAWVSEALVGLALAGAVYVLGGHPSLFSRWPPYAQHLGAEYYNIGAALSQGRGYSDPFGGGTGPTAWMPPLIPFVLAGLLTALKTKAAVAQAFVILSGAAHVASGLAVYRIAKASRAILPPALAVALYVGWLWTFYGWYFLMTHDIAILSLLVSAIALALSRYEARGRLDLWSWGVLGGVASLASPSLAFAWLGLSVLLLRRAPRGDRRRLVASLVVAGCLAAPWVARNALVFHRFIPTKSNVFYEAYQANDLDDDGIYDGTFENHPYNAVIVRYQYAEAGEMRFVDDHERRFLASVRRAPRRYLEHALNRLLAVTVRFAPSRSMPETERKALLERVVYALPLALLAAALLVGRPPSARALARRAGLFCGLYLVPYVLVAYYPRYSLPLAPLCVLFVFLGADGMAAAYARRIGPPSAAESAGQRAGRLESA